MASHSYRPFLIDNFSEKVFINLVVGGTIFFVFISGFFFHYIYYKKFEYWSFLKKKTINVFTPFFIVSLIGFIYFVMAFGRHPYDVSTLSGGPFTIADYGVQFIKLLWTGMVLAPYWFVPTIMVIFALSPIFIFLIKQNTKIQIGVFIILFFMATIVHRPILDISIYHSVKMTLHSVLYYLPVYWLGVICAVHKEYVFQAIKNKAVYFALGAVICAALEVIIYDKYSNFHKEDIFSFQGFDLMLIQKLFLCFFFLSFLQRFEGKDIALLKHLSATTFAIYLLHPWAMFFLHEGPIFTPIHKLPGEIAYIITTVLYTVISLLVAYIIRGIMGRRSRYIIGW